MSRVGFRTTRVLLPAVVVGILPAGCGIGGRWETVRVDPPHASFEPGYVTFDSGGRYTASARVDGEWRTSTGAYEWKGGSLVLHPADGPPRTYRARRSPSGAELTLEHRDGETLHVATLHRVD